MQRGLRDVEIPVAAQHDALRVAQRSGQRGHRAIGRDPEQHRHAEAAVHEHATVERADQVGSQVLSPRQRRQRREGVVDEAIERATGAEHDQPVPDGRHAHQAREHGAAGAAAPRAREERRGPIEPARQRQARVERDPEHERPPVILVAELLEPAGRAVLLRRDVGVDVIHEHEAAGAVEHDRAAAGQPPQTIDVERQPLVAIQPVDAAAVLLADEEVARAWLEGEAAQRGQAAIEKGHPHARPVGDVDGQRAVEVDAIDLPRGVAAGAGTEHDERAPVEGELQRAWHAGRDDLQSRGHRGLARGPRGEDEGGGHRRAAAPADEAPLSRRRPPSA